MTSQITRVGELRPSQLLHTFGVGSVVDLPYLSGLVLGLDEWDTTEAPAIVENRLLAVVRDVLGHQVSALRLPPYVPESPNAFDDSWTRVGVPVATFPRWLRCRRCNYLGPISSGLFDLKHEPYRPDRVRYEHGCATRGRPPPAIPVRFLLACRNNHLDDFPWDYFVHRGQDCPNPLLDLRERGATGEATDVVVRCRSCDATRRMVEAFGETGEQSLPRCRARHPHLASFGHSCDQPVRTTLLGASNLWFADSISVLSVPEYEEPLYQKVVELWDILEPITGKDILAYARAAQPKMKSLASYSDDEILAAIEEQRAGAASGFEEAGDVLAPEWAAFGDPDNAPASDDFRLRAAALPNAVKGGLEEVVLAERLREVRALVGFTRIDAPGDRTEDEDVLSRAPLSRQDPVWVPCAEVRGEGLFLRFPENELSAWEHDVQGTQRAGQLFDGHRQWRQRRGLTSMEGFPGLRYVLLHTFAHLLIRCLALEAGYGAASLRERLYARSGPEPMAGVLLYTAATDSEGTLGGLVSLGEPDVLGRMITQALGQAGLCTSDPMCAEHAPAQDASTHGAACHACLFASETSCERGNRYLDRALVTDTFTTSGLGFFDR